MDLKNKTILVTGGSGFIGKNIVEHFRDQTTVLAPTHKQLDLLSQENVRDYLKDRSVDFVLHCANVGWNRTGNAQSVVSKNLMMFFNLSENSRYYTKLIQFGSGAEYDKHRPIIKIKEYALGESIPTDDYGFSKYVISKYIEKSGNNICLRLFGVFGKYEDYNHRFISNAIMNNLKRVPIQINQNVRFDYLYVNDLMKIIPYFFDYNDYTYKVYNVTPGESVDLVTIAETINSLSKYKSKITVKKKGMDNEYTGNNSRLLEKIGAFKFTPLETAITDLTGYYKSILNGSRTNGRNNHNGNHNGNYEEGVNP
jgi:GDP-L-fucose synthase